MIEPTSSASTFPSPLARMRPPYQTLEPVSPERGLPPVRPVPAGEALVWFMAGGDWERCFQLARSRAPGVALIVILPPAPQSESDQERILRTVERCHPHSVLPHHPDPDLEELELVLRRPSAYPQDDIVEYLGWRGLRITQEMRELIRRVLELSSEIGSVSALARGVFISRRALGRRFLSAGLPVPSHWLQMGRLMRIVGVIQAEPTSLFNAGTALGYSDGFAVSNQMVRLTGVRPSKVRTHLGWEWVLEAWLRREAENGGFSPTNARI
ncbi:MAG: AraC family transcriptional regulator, partial [Gemmatimonadetes bacterium]